MAWLDTHAPTCDACRDIYRHRNPPQSPPCGRCKVELLEENEDAAEVFTAVRYQAFGGGEIPIQTIKIMMDLYGVKDQRACLEKVKMIHWKRKRPDESSELGDR